MAEGTRHNGHPRFFGYVSSPGTAVAAVADFLASVLNANLVAWRSAPAPTELERLTIDWIKEALGCDPAAGGLFTSGGSMANLTALVAARHRHRTTRQDMTTLLQDVRAAAEADVARG